MNSEKEKSRGGKLKLRWTLSNGELIVQLANHSKKAGLDVKCRRALRWADAKAAILLGDPQWDRFGLFALRVRNQEELMQRHMLVQRMVHMFGQEMCLELTQRLVFPPEYLGPRRDLVPRELEQRMQYHHQKIDSQKTLERPEDSANHWRGLILEQCNLCSCHSMPRTINK